MHSCSMPFYCKPPTLLLKIEDSTMDELMRGMRELKLKMAKLDNNRQALEKSSKQLL